MCAEDHRCDIATPFSQVTPHVHSQLKSYTKASTRVIGVNLLKLEHSRNQSASNLSLFI